LVWAGTIIMVIGFFISVFYRRERLKGAGNKTKEKKQAASRELQV